MILERLILILSIFLLLILSAIPQSLAQSATSFRGFYIGQSSNDAFDLAKKMGFNLNIRYTAIVKLADGKFMNQFECRNKQDRNSFITENNVVVEFKLYGCFFEFYTFDATLFKSAVTDAYKLTNWRISGIGMFADTPYGEVIELNVDGYRHPYIVVTRRPFGKF